MFKLNTFYQRLEQLCIISPYSCVTNVLIGLDSSTEYCLRCMKEMKCYYCPNLQVVARCLNGESKHFFFHTKDETHTSSRE